MGWLSLGGILGGNLQFALPVELANFVEAASPFANEISVRRASRQIFDQPGLGEGAAGSLVANLLPTQRSSGERIGSRTRDFMNFDRLLKGAGVSVQASGRLRNIEERRLRLGDTDFSVGREKLDVESKRAVGVSTTYLRLSATAQLPDGYATRREGVEREPVAINASFGFGKNNEYVLSISVGVDLHEMAAYCKERATNLVRRVTPVNKTMVANMLDNMTEPWEITGRNQIKVSRDSLDVTRETLAPLMKGPPVLNAKLGRWELDTVAGPFTLEGVDPLEMAAISSTRSAIEHAHQLQPDFGI